MSRVRGAVLAVALLVPILLAATPAGAARAQWWGATEPGEGHHLRVGAVVRNPGAARAANSVVAFEVDLGAALAEAGWPHTMVAGTPRVQGFRLDESSVRVVAMTDLLAAAPGTSHGLLRAVDLGFPAGDARRYELPSQTYLGSLTSHVAYHPAVSPIVTVIWRIPEPLAANEERAFYVYFDSLLSSDAKPDPPQGDTLLGGDELGLFWSGWGTRLYGFSKPIEGKANALTVVAARGATDVEVLAAAPGKPFQRLEAFRIDAALGPHQVAVPGTSPLVLKVESSAPVLAQSTSTGFVPSLDAGMTGRDFVFAMTHAAAWEQDTVYFAATDPFDEDGRLEATSIEVTRLDGAMDPLRFDLGGSASPRDYSVGARASIVRGQCARPIPGAASPTLPFGPGLYRARVLSGERVLLQHQSVDALSQAPSITGAPIGDEFMAAFGWSDEGGLGPSCDLATRPASMYAANTGSSATFTVTSDDLVFQAYPRGSPSPVSARFPPGRVVGGDRTLQGPFEITARDSADRMLNIEATDRLQVLVGQAQPQTGVGGNMAPYAAPTFGVSNVPVVNGPVGGAAGGRSFTGMGPAVLVSPFDGNNVDLALHYQAGWQLRSLTLSRDAMVELADASSSNPLLDYRIQSRFPLVVNPSLASSGTFAAVPQMLSAQRAAASFRGYLLDLSSPDGDPATRSTSPGTAASFPITLSNLASAADGTPVDDQALVTADAPPGWAVFFDGAPIASGKAVPLAPGQVRTATLSVLPPADVAVDTTQAVTLRATSAGNDRVADTLQVVTFVKTVYNIGLWFDAVDGAKEQEIQVDDDGVADFTLVLQNAGSKTERVHLSIALRGGAAGWQSAIDGETSMELDVPPSKAGMPLALHMVAPAGAPDAEATAVVTANIVRSPAAKDAVQATAVRRAPADVQLHAPKLTAFTLPGEAAVFPIEVTSASGGVIHLEVQWGTTLGWLAPRLEVGQSHAIVDSLTLTAGQVASLSLLVTPTAGAFAGNTTTVRLAALDRDGNARERVFFTKVLPRHALTVTASPAIVAVDGPGANSSFTLHWSNQGNLAEHLLLATGQLPPGWALDLPPELLVARSGSQDVTVKVSVPATAAAGLYNLTFLGRAADGNRTITHVQVVVGDLARAGVGPSTGAVLAQPGGQAILGFNASNNGTVAVRVSVAHVEGEAWTFDRVPDVLVQPNQTVRLAIHWQIPRTAPDGTTLHRASVHFQGPDGDLPGRMAEGAIDVGRADLRIHKVSVIDGPAGGLVRTTVANVGQRAALGFDVEVVDASGQALDTVHVAQLVAGANLTMVLALTKDSGTLRLDADDAVPELHEDDNEAALQWEAPRDAPGASVAATALLLAALALTRRRR